jgi:hypothetical protein
MSDINYVVIDHADMYPAKKIKSKYFREMKELYERGFKLNDFKESSPFKDDITILMYNKDILLGFVFIKEEKDNVKNSVTNGITDPFFYNFVIDPKYQYDGHGSALFEHIKRHYFNRPLYCLVDSTNTTLHEWYDRREGIVYNNSDMKWKKGYFVYIFTNGSSGQKKKIKQNTVF